MFSDLDKVNKANVLARRKEISNDGEARQKPLCCTNG